jgi:hypothetical protein
MDFTNRIAPANLTGKALKDRAAELNVKGRSAMNVADLRQAIVDAENAAITLDSVFSQEPAESVSKPEVKPTPTMLGQMLARFREAREARAEAGRDASKDSMSAAPMSTSRREFNYREMNNGGEPRPGNQARRIKHKHNKNFA